MTNPPSTPEEWEICSRCKLHLQRNKFHKNKARKSGLNNYCKPCTLLIQKERRVHSKSYAEWLPKRAKRLREKRADGRYKERDKRNAKISRKRWPEKHRARKLLTLAIKSGKVIKLYVCQNCKKSCKTHGHHEDYSKPLKVEWLCVQCHSNKHNKRALIDKPTAK